MSRALWIAPILACASWWVWWGVSTGYYVTLNDFWGLLVIAEQLSTSDPRSLHNGFFPIGYPLWLRMAGGTSVLAVAFLTSVASATVTLTSLGMWLHRQVGPRLAASAVFALAAHPLFFQHAVTSSPDMPMTAAAVAGLLALADALEQRATRRAVLAATLVGAAVLLRYHAGALVAGLLLGGLVAWRSRWRLVAAATLASCAVAGVQVAVNMWAGVGPLRTAQVFNVYKLFNPVDWYHLPPPDLPASVWDVIQRNPAGFWQAYWGQLSGLWPLLALAAVCALVAAGPHRRVSTFLLVVVLCYLPMQALGGSARGPLPALPLVIVAATLALQSLTQRRLGRPLTGVVVAATLAWAGVRWMPANQEFLRGQAGNRAASASVEALLRADGVQRAAEVYTDSGDFYFVSTRRARVRAMHPLTPGGWARVDLYGFDRAFPQLRLSTLDEFLSDCRHHGVTHLALTPSASAMVAGLSAAVVPDTVPSGLRWVGHTGGLTVVALTRP